MSLRTDLTIVQYPNPLPNFGGLLGANTIATDPDFGTKIVRLTDASVSTNRSMQTADAAQAGLWNTNDTLFLARNTESTSFLYQFNPATMQGTLLPFVTHDQVCFSRVNPGILYTLHAGKIIQNLFTFTNGAWSFTSSSTLFDFTTALPVGFVIKSTSVFNVSYDDSTFSVGFSDSTQNTGIYVCAWQRAKGYRLLNLNTAEVTGQWGTHGKVHLTSTNYKFPMTFHEVYQALNPEFAIVNPFGTADTSLIWEVDGLNLVDNDAAGHKAYGRLGYYAGGPGGGQLAFGTFLSPTIHTMVVKPQNLPAAVGQHYKEDLHIGFGKVLTGDDSTIWASSGGNGAFPFVSAWENEVRGYDPVLGVVYRVCHTFDSNQSKEFIVNNAIAVPSQTGKFVAFTSDCMGDLGSTSGGAKGTLGVDARGDVFIVATEQ